MHSTAAVCLCVSVCRFVCVCEKVRHRSRVSRCMCESVYCTAAVCVCMCVLHCSRVCVCVCSTAAVCAYVCSCRRCSGCAALRHNATSSAVPLRRICRLQLLFRDLKLKLFRNLYPNLSHYCTFNTIFSITIFATRYFCLIFYFMLDIE